MRYIAFLRGVNVGGRVVKMAELRQSLESSDLGLENVGTYIQSGNVFFDAPARGRKTLQKKLQAHLSAEFGFEIPVLLRSIDEVIAAIEGSPYPKGEPASDERRLVLFVDPALPESTKFPFANAKGDVSVIGSTGGEVFVQYWLTDGRPPSFGAALDKQLPAVTTGRFLHTLRKIVTAAQG